MRRIFFMVMLSLALAILPTSSLASPVQYLYNGPSNGELHWNLSPGQVIRFSIIVGGSLDVPDTSDLTAVQQGLAVWENDPGSYVNFDYLGTTTVRGGQNDFQNVVDFFNSQPDCVNVVAQTYTYFDVISRLIVDVDTVFNELCPFSTNLAPGTYDIQDTMSHEAGHWLYLYDLGIDDAEQTMYGTSDYQETKRQSLEFGDKAGVRYIYIQRPGLVVQPISATTLERPTSPSVRLISGDPPTVVVAWADAPTGADTMKYRVGFDLNPESGQAASWSADFGKPGSLGENTAGVGVALADINANSILDLIIAWVDAPAGRDTMYYQIGWDLDCAGFPVSWSPQKTAVTTTDMGDNTADAGIAFSNIDGTGGPELIAAWVNAPSGADTIYYKVGTNVNTAGEPASWGSRLSKTDTIGDNTGGMGITFANIGGAATVDMIFFWVDDPSGRNHGYYQVGYDVSSSGIPSGTPAWSSVKKIPGDWQWIGDLTAGAGVAATELNGAAGPEMIFLWIDAPAGADVPKYRVEWQGRVDSHA